MYQPICQPNQVENNVKAEKLFIIYTNHVSKLTSTSYQPLINYLVSIYVSPNKTCTM